MSERRRSISLLLLGLALGGAGSNPVAVVEDGPLPVEQRALSAFSEDPNRRFDFWIGDWDVNLRIHQQDLSWQDSVEARARVYSILRGKAILELWESAPIKGFSLRYYDPTEQKWVLWLNWPGENRAGMSRLEGRFRHGRGDFFGESRNAEGQTVISRFSFNDVSPKTMRWDDAYSSDGGKTWSNNWIMEWTRRAAEAVWPLPSPAPTFVDGTLCDQEPFRVHEVLAGDWSGKASEGPGESAAQPASLEMRQVLDGCAVLGFLQAGDAEWFLMTTFDTRRELWELSVLSHARRASLERFWAREDPMVLSSSDEEKRYRLAMEGQRDLTIEVMDTSSAGATPLRSFLLHRD